MSAPASCWPCTPGAPALDYAIVAGLLLVAVLSLEGIVAVHHLRQAKLDSLHLLLEVLNDYRSAEMTLALVALWRFRREHGEQFVEAYLDTWRRDEDRIAGQPAEARVEAMRATLHYRRRAVKEFFNLLAGLYELKVLPREVVYTYWSESELAIIPEVLIPLETAVARELRMEKELGAWLQRLRRLHGDCCVATPGRGANRLPRQAGRAKVASPRSPTVPAGAGCRAGSFIRPGLVITNRRHRFPRAAEKPSRR